LRRNESILSKRWSFLVLGALPVSPKVVSGMRDTHGNKFLATIG
jgi:hypothetical protein